MSEGSAKNVSSTRSPMLPSLPHPVYSIHHRFTLRRTSDSVASNVFALCVFGTLSDTGVHAPEESITNLPQMLNRPWVGALLAIVPALLPSPLPPISAPVTPNAIPISYTGGDLTTAPWRLSAHSPGELLWAPCRAFR